MDVSHLISIVGGGPGDPELLTVKAMKRLQQADVVLYDGLLREEVLDLTTPECEKIFVGKYHSDGQNQEKRQEDIHRWFKFYAEQGKKVVRLKTGDPMIFGRGPEEIRFCVEHQLNYEVIPGVTAALAGSAQFNVPLTERHKACMALFYTGHRTNGTFSDLEALTAVLSTGSPVMIYMGLNKLAELSKALLERGVEASTTVQILSKISQPEEQHYETSLEDVDNFLAENNPQAPTVIIIGEHALSIQ
ncbi:uroporphyrinogen-III C-methyltransferase [Maribellus sediminis]|uniref:uroporphyrinogen-III C-methyltransferase n=1 Tax=Maribellus sediminis TaxID=2696285 RepID=UPI00143011DA|nr:uroporphyrinogen-III C-methyltransferase [Maribellus sediminis]